MLVRSIFSKRKYDILSRIESGEPKISKSCRALLFLRNRVVSAAAPRMTAEQPFESQPGAFERTVFAHRLQGVLRTRRHIATGGRLEGRYAVLVKFDKQNQQLAEQMFEVFHLIENYKSGAKAVTIFCIAFLMASSVFA